MIVNVKRFSFDDCVSSMIDLAQKNLGFRVAYIYMRISLAKSDTEAPRICNSKLYAKLIAYIEYV